MRRTQALTGLTLLLLSAACTAATASAGSAGTVTGRLMIDGGPIHRDGKQPAPRPIPGTVRFTSGHRRVTVAVNGSGRFSVQLPAGRYDISDRSPAVQQESADGTTRQIWSRPLSATVTPHHTTQITLTIDVP